MNKKILLGVGVVILVIIVFGFLPGKKSTGLLPVAQAREVTVYREATCGCCKAYLSYLEKRGYKIHDNVMKDVSGIKDQYGVPKDMRSCHTSIIDGYVVEGHMPIEAIEKMLLEKPEISGISLPGMPAGSPGMPGAKRGMFEIHSLMEESTKESMMFMSL